MQSTQDFPAKLLVLISLVQGLILLLLHQAIQLNFWPDHSPHWLFSFYAMAFVGPSMLLLGLSSGQVGRWFKFVLPFTLLIGALGYYIGRQATPIQHVRYEALLFALIPSLILAAFKAQIYLQQYIQGGVFTYANLFRWSWRNFLTLLLASLFAFAVWGLLMLWAWLFKSIKIDFFYDLFTERWFYYPAIAMANGFGVIIFRRLSNVIDVITRLQQALMKYLLIMLVFVSIIFLVSLPFSGLDSLWDSGGSALILCMQALMLFFVNAVYQDNSEERPYHLLIHRFIYLGVLLLPIYSAISFYGLTLRITQYGWSVDRCWAMVIWLLLAIFSLGYAWGIVKYRDHWLGQLSKINVAVGLIVLVLMLLVNTPILDFRKITVNSQLSLLQAGKTTLDDLDIFYFRDSLARPGYEALEKLKVQYAETNPEFISRVNRQYLKSMMDDGSLETQEQFIAGLKITSSVAVPDTLLKQLYEYTNVGYYRDSKQLYLVAMDLNRDETLEYIFVQKFDYRSQLTLYYLENNEWQQSSLRQMDGYDDVKYNAEFYDAIRTGAVQVVQPKWPEIKIGELQFQVQ